MVIQLVQIGRNRWYQMNKMAVKRGLALRAYKPHRYLVLAQSQHHPPPPPHLIRLSTHHQLLHRPRFYMVRQIVQQEIALSH